MRVTQRTGLWVAAMSAFLVAAGCGAPLVIEPGDGGLDARAPTIDSGPLDTGTTDGGPPGCAGCLIGTTCHPDGTQNPTNPCEVCDRATSATAFSANDGVLCDDGQFCTTGDSCSARVCTGTARSCDDSIACNGVGTCDETTDACVAGTTTCMPGELCDGITGACVTTCAGCAIGTNCFGDGQLDPANVCQHCDPAVSRSAFSANDGVSCDDGAFCTTGDTCAASVCAGATGSRCGDGIDCNGTETCDETANSCVPGATTCGPSEICDVATDTCVATCTGCFIGGACVGAGQRNPSNQCEVCDPTVSTSAYVTNDGASCDDGMFCTNGDVCTGSTCGGTARSCSDGIACNGVETCSETGDTCAAGASTCGAGTSCDPGTDSCVASCADCTIGGSCFGAGQVNPMNPCEVCRTATPTVWSANDGASCDDGLFCTDTDRCTARACSGSARTCTDGVACNGTETCSEATDSCVAGTTTCAAGQVCNPTTDLCVTTCSGCVVGGTCFAAGTTNPSNACEVCDITRTRTAFSTNDGAPCNDGQFCTRSDVCSGSLCAGTATNFCSDGVACNGVETCNETSDSCVAGGTTCMAGQVCNSTTDMCVATCSGCVVGGVCYAPSTTNPTNQCQICDPARSATAFSPNTGARCDDGLFCTAIDTCNASAVCTGSARNCSDGVACSGTETCNEATDRCDPGTSTCPAGRSCDVPTDTCVISCAGCVIGGTCFPPGSTSGGCLVCDPARSTTAWSNQADGTSCDDRLYCTIADRCVSGMCTGGGARGCADAYACNGVETCNETTDTCDDGTSTCAPGTFCNTTGAPPGTCAATCSGTICGTACVQTATDPDNCGACGNVCPARPHTTRLCGGTPAVCQYACAPGFLDCNGGTDGCEVSGTTCVIPPGCTATSIAFAPESTAGTVRFSAADDQTTGLFPMGMTFRFFGIDYTNIDISSNGFVGFSPGMSQGCCSPDPIPLPDGIDNIISSAWHDLYVGSGVGEIRTELRGTSPNRRFVISYVNVGFFCCGETPHLDSQIILYEGSNTIEIHTARQDASTYTQGVENATGSIGCSLPGRSSGFFGLTNDAVRFTTM
jgi:hypothetical protein